MMRSYRKLFIGGLIAMMMLIASLVAVKTTLIASTLKGNLTGIGVLENTDELAEVFNVVLPVVPEKPVTENISSSSIYDFILDPKQLAPTLDKYLGNTFESGSTMYFKNENGGGFDYSKKSDALTIKNKSTMNVDVEVEASLIGMDGIKLVGDDIFTSERGATIYLAVEDSNKKISAVDRYGAFLKAVVPGRRDAYKIGYNTLAHKYGYELKTDAELQAENITFSEYAFWLTGACNSANKWPDLNGVIEPETKVVWKVSPRPNNVAPSVGKDTYIITKEHAIAIDVDMGEGDLKATNIKEIRFTRASGKAAVLETHNYSLENGMLKINADYISTLLNGNVISRDYMVVFDDKAQTERKITLVADDESPSIEKESYLMVSGQPVEIDVDLGSGELGATGIKEIRFVRLSNEVAKLPSSNYTFSDGKLKFNAEYITNLIASGTISRDYTIVFNDKAGTEITVNLEADGQVPSISGNEYIVAKGEAVEIDVDLGLGDLKATGVSAITFTTDSNETGTLTTSDYVYEAGKLKITAEYITNLINTGAISCDYIITFNNVANTQVKIKLKAKDESPFIEEKSYIMNNGAPVQIPVELGSGNLRATGISTITFTKPSGDVGTVPSDNYVCQNGILKFKTVYITNLISWGIISRDYTIVFNDKANTTKTINLFVDGEIPSIEEKTYTMERGKPVDINVNLGSEDLKATKVSEIQFVRASGAIATLSSENYVFIGERLRFKTAHILNLIDAGIVSRNYTIIFDDIAKTKVEITLTAKEVAPSIKETVCTMRIGQPAQINVDLGSGTIGATSIQSIMFTRPSGVSAVLPIEYYSFSNGVLQFNASYITSMISAGVMSRDYVITFNDKANTTNTISLVVSGQVPSIKEKMYTMERGKPVDVNVNLGTGDLKATKISQIQFVRASGVVATLSAENFAFVGERLRFKTAYISSLIDARVTSRNYTIIFDNVAKTKVEITLTAK